jgi:uncharacterized protein
MSELVGRGFAFPPQIDSQGQLALTGQTNEINQAIRMIIGTAPGERVMRPDFGCRIHELIFDPNNEQTHANAERYVEEALGRWEPRIIVNDVTARADDNNMGVLILEVQYTIKGTSDPRSLVYPFYLLPDDQA